MKSILWLATVSLALAHPMGNFSVSHYSGITINRSSIDVRYLLDIAEIPTFQEMQQSDTHSPAYLTAKSVELVNGLHLTLNGRPLALCLGIPPMMQRLSGSIVAVVLCFQAASPAGVNGSFSPGRSLARLPTGLVSRVPFQ